MRKRVLKILLILVIAFVSLNNSTFAADICTISLVPNKTQIKPGESVTFEVRATNINDSKGIILFAAYVNYDDNALTFNTANIGGDGWSGTVSENYISMQRTSLEPSKENQVIAKLTFTAKSNASVANKTIGLENISVTTETNTYDNLKNVSENFSIVESTPQNTIPENVVPQNEVPANEIPTNEIPVNEVPQNEIPANEILENEIDENIIKDNEVEDKNQISQENLIDDGKKEDATRSKDRVLPQTGTAEIVGAIALVLLIISAVIFHKKYNKWYGI